MNTKYAIIAVAAIAAIALVLGGGAASAYATAQSTAKGIQVSIVNLASVDMLRNTTGYHLEVAVTLNNTASIPATLKDVKYGIYAGGTPLGNVTLARVEVPANTNVTKYVQLNVTSKDGVKAVTQAIFNNSMYLEVRMEGKVPVTLYGITQLSSIPVNKSVAYTVDVGPYLTSYLKSQIKVYGPMGMKTAVTATGMPQATRLKPISLNSKADEYQVKVTYVRWYSDGHEITSAGKHQHIIVSIGFEKLQDKSFMSKNKVKIEIEVRRDIKWFPDSDLKEEHYTYDLTKLPKYFEISIPFTTEDKHLLRGYFIRVSLSEWCSANGAPTPCWVTIYDMSNHYPPRLKVG